MWGPAFDYDDFDYKETPPANDYAAFANFFNLSASKEGDALENTIMSLLGKFSHFEYKNHIFLKLNFKPFRLSSTK